MMGLGHGKSIHGNFNACCRSRTAVATSTLSVGRCSSMTSPRFRRVTEVNLCIAPCSGMQQRVSLPGMSFCANMFIKNRDAANQHTHNADTTYRDIVVESVETKQIYFRNMLSSFWLVIMKRAWRGSWSSGCGEVLGHRGWLGIRRKHDKAKVDNYRGLGVGGCSQFRFRFCCAQLH